MAMPGRARLLVLLALLHASCSSSDDPPCGDGSRGAYEECDGDDLPVRCHPEAGTITCSAECTIDYGGCTAYCGDGLLDGTGSEPEECDGPSNPRQCHPGAGVIGCNPDCTIDDAGCSAYCGDGVVNGPEGQAEQCDGASGLPACPWWCTGSWRCTAECHLVNDCLPTIWTMPSCQ